MHDQGNDATGEGINLDTASQYWIERDGRRVSIRYDALNSITPVGISVDGNMTFEVQPDGRIRKVRDDRDDYPSQGVYQYRPGGETVVVDGFTEENVFCGAMPINIW